MAYYDDFGKYGDRTAVIDENGQKISYQEMDALCKDMGRGLTARTLVFSFCENGIGSIAGYLSFLQNRAVPVLLDRHIAQELRQNLLGIYQPDYLYVPADMAEDFPDFMCIWEGWNYRLLRTDYESKGQLYPELALLLTTSGSTGSPKLVRQSYENIQSNAESIAEYLELDETERPITTLPMNYTYGLSIINSHVLCGATLIATRHTLMEREFWKLFQDEQATSFGGVPYTYEILKKLRFFRMDLPSLRYMTQAGGKLVPDLHKEFAEYARDHGRKFIVMYGQCEATARMAYLPAQKSLEKYGSMGIAIPGGRLELIDVAGNVIEEPDQVGELVYYGTNVTLGYAQERKDLEKGDERFGRLETGDMAKRDDEGYYYIVGRKKRFLKIYGNRVNLDEAERMVKKYLPGVDCACGGVDDHLYVFVTMEDETKRDEIRSFLSEKTNLHPSAFTIRYLEQIPKNEAGKTLYRRLEDFYDGI